MTEYTIHTTNVDRRSVRLTYPIEAERVERRVELAAQGVALGLLDEGLTGGDLVHISALWQARPIDPAFNLAACTLTVTDATGRQLAEEEVLAGEMFLLETQAALNALSTQHYVFRPGERAVSFLYFEGDAPPAEMTFNYRLPLYDEAISGEEATISATAAGVIGALVQDDGGVEQRAFAVGAIGPKGGCVVTDVLVPPGQGEAEAATVDFSAGDWAFAQDAVAHMGDPFRILGPMHTHPPGSLTPSPDDWELFQWAGDAASLFVIASMVQGQPIAAAYRWRRGSLSQVDLHVEQVPTHAVPEEV